MNDDIYCSMIHGGMQLTFGRKRDTVQHCCIRDTLIDFDSSSNPWNTLKHSSLRQKNTQGEWDPGCHNCHRLEQSGMISFRQGMNQGLGIVGKTELVGPVRLDLRFDISCNLACRTCGPGSSTFWQKHLKAHNEWPKPIFSHKKSEDVIAVLETIDLSNLRQVVFCGGETLLGKEYWNVAKWLVEHVPEANNNLTLCFQTNATQSISPENFDTVRKTHLVKLHFSIDGIGERFEYLRWPAVWSEVVDNIMHIRDSAPSNVMMVVEETVSIFNLFYLNESKNWISNNFNSNREGDPVNHTYHLAYGIYSLESCSQEYVDALKYQDNKNLIPLNWSENQERIHTMLREIGKFDNFRQQDFSKTFPEVAEFYSRFLN